ncbi:YcdB/YcdC domain-containing protein [Clostridium uliginosum]|uniref:YcdB/YcdC repeated domain-containing protein n=1 Tax=Clostridium uliginosum TaxID=119641 RepID=A0A1I1PME4_9CLOT|nr:YcdB/YcdC domain-containing protein [Clostridium uliginosum]SFD10847.1 hypothetical protein SAMN05421842_12016 [Clostridium uliginosum]
MNSKKTKIIISVILALLIVIVIFVMHNFVGLGAKDIKVAKNFIEKLYSINAINKQEDLKSIKYKRVKTLNTKNELIYKTIVTDSFGIDLDKNYNIIGFANKELVKVDSEITVEEAKSIADQYLSKIYDKEVTFKTIKSDEDAGKLPYYSFVYLKSKYGYPLYFNEIIVNINKSTGFLDNYTNSSIQKECKEPILNISKEMAEIEALDTFVKYHKNGQISNITELAYADNKSISELCYVVAIKGKDENGADITWKLFVSTETKEIVNILKYGTEDSVIAN